MPWEIFGLLILILVVFCTVTGFVTLLLAVVRAFRPGSSSPVAARDETPAAGTSPVAFCKQLNWLYENGLIAAESYLETRQAVEKRFGEQFPLPARVALQFPPAADGAALRTLSETVPGPDQSAITGGPTGSPADSAVGGEASGGEEPGREAAGIAPDGGPRPWEESGPAPVRRGLKWQELLKSFMEERNIRWGELASGMLIVGSAIGLVLSLRRELSNTIPYFPALLFMLFSLAIHGAGAYTLRRWKLRSTSRGLLLIALLIVPLNFLAAVLLAAAPDGRRTLADPLVWLAAGVGLAGFGWMSWSSSRLLFRRGVWLPVIAAMGTGISVLVTNRGLDWFSPEKHFLLALPLAGMAASLFLILDRVVCRRRLTERTLNRTWLLAGVTLFSLLTGLALFVLRGSPAVSVVAGLAGPAGVAVWAAVLLAGRLRERTGAAKYRIHRMAAVCCMAGLGTGLLVLGGFAATGPVDLMIYGAGVGSAVVVSSFVRRWAVLFPAGVALLTLAVIVPVNVAAGNVNWTQSLGPAGLTRLMVNGHTALCWLAGGFLLAAMTPWMNRWFGDGLSGSPAVPGESGEPLLPVSAQYRWYSVLPVTVGAVTGLVAARIHAGSLFDTTVGTGLLACLGLVLTVNSLAGVNPRRPLLAPLAAIGVVVLAAVEAGFWNPFFFGWLDAWRPSIAARGLLAFTMSSAVLAAAAWSARLGRNAAAERGVWESARLAPFAAAATVTALAGLVLAGAVLQDPARGSTAVAAGLLGLSAAAAAVAWRERLGWIVELASLPMTVIWAALYWQQDPGGELIASPHHWLFQLRVLAGWSLVWLVVRRMPAPAGAWKEVVESRIGGRQLSELVAVAAPVLIVVWSVVGLANPVLREVVAVWQNPTVSEWESPVVRVQLSLACLFWLAVLAGVVLQYGRSHHAQWGVILLACLALLQSGLWDYDTGVATAARWLLAGAALGTSALFLIPSGSVDAIGTVAGRLPAGWFGRSFRLRVILASLAFTAGLGLAIAFLAVSAFLMLGPEAVGGPRKLSWLGSLRKDASYGLPVGMILAGCLVHAISQRRSGFAWAGSAVLQGIVVVQLVLLVLSPHPKLASEWFVSIVQSVSIAMTAYGAVWYAARVRIEGDTAAGERVGGVEDRVGGFWSRWGLPALECHAVLNAILVLGLVGLVLVRCFLVPASSAGWINHAASPLGIAAALALAVFLWILFAGGRRRDHSWPVALFLITAVTFAAANLDRWLAAPGWVPFQTVAWGLWCASAIQVAWRSTGWRTGAAGDWSGQRGTSAAPAVFTGMLCGLFAIRGMMVDVSRYTEFAVLLVLLTAVWVVGGSLRQSPRAAWGCLGLVQLQCVLLGFHDPRGWFTSRWIDWFHFAVMSQVGLALVWLGSAVIRRWGWRVRASAAFLAMPAWVGLLASLWLFLAPALGWVDWFPGNRGVTVWNGWGLACLVSVLVLIVAGWWGGRGGFPVTTRCLFSLSIPAVVLAWMPDAPQSGLAVWLLLEAGVVALWAVRLQWGVELRVLAERWGIRRAGAARRWATEWLPVYGSFAGMLIAAGAFLAVVFPGARMERFLAAFALPLLGMSQSVFANATRRCWHQYFTIGLVVAGAVLVSWADLAAGEWGVLPVLARAFLVFGGAVFLLGLLGNRWMQAGDWWRLPVLRSSVLVAACSVALLAGIVAVEWMAHRQLGPIQPATVQAYAVVLTAVLLSAGLILVAVSSRIDPLALPGEWRQVYVYAAQLVLVLAGAHAVLEMPWLLRLGMRDYWPWLAMLLAFGGIGLSELLRRRDLRVLSEPLASTMGVLPVLAAAASLVVANRADSAVTMLLAGLVCLLVTGLRRSLWSGILAVVFGNAALWLYYGRWPGLEFLAHPQLWLIPPALSALAVVETGRKKFGERERLTIRYVALAVVYVSSTGEVFLQGLGDRLWPPMVLATLAVSGILGGMLLRTRALVGIGMLFLLVALTAMVSHAQRRLGHVWPWWAFGITLGILILVLFGVFERRRNQLRRSGETVAPDSPDGDPATGAGSEDVSLPSRSQ